MTRKQATFKQLEAAAHTLKTKGIGLNYENINNILEEQNLSITKSKFFQYIYDTHLYDWKDKVSKEELICDIESFRKISILEKTLSQVKATLESTADGILMVTREGKMINWNKKFMEMFRFPESVLSEQNEQKALQYFLDQVVDPQELFNLVTRGYDDPNMKGEMGDMYFKDGRILERYSQPHFAGDQIIGRVWSFRDVTERRKKDQELLLRERAIEASTHGVIITGTAPDYKVLYVNPAFTKITDQTKQDILGKSCFGWLKVADQEATVDKIHLSLKEEREDQIVLAHYHQDGTPYFIEINIAPVYSSSKHAPGTANDISNQSPETEHGAFKSHPKGVVAHFVWIINDITQRKMMEDKLAYQATHDILTELPNRSLLRDRLQQAILNAKREGLLVAICFLDLDRFKLVNDGLGHGVGDQVLQTMATRLLKCIRETDTFGRLGGDEFVIISLVEHEFQVTHLIRRVLKQISQPITLGQHNINITGSIGISLYPSNGTDLDTLMKNADIAMYRAKELGRDNFQFFTAEMNATISQRLELESDLRTALLENQFHLNYQPIVNLTSGKIAGLEILLRWNHPQKGNIPPLDFIPIAEESGLIVPIGHWIIKAACTKFETLQAASLEPLYLAINISSEQFKRDNLSGFVHDILKEAHIPPNSLEFELTESIWIEDNKKVLQILTKLKEHHIRLVIDDFGTGYSNLGYLKQFPLDKIKIDKSFIDGLNTNPNDAAIARTIIAIAHILGLKVVAEGVETINQIEFLQQHQCDQIQGFYFSKPLDEENIIQLLKKNPTLS